jgi:hypothetical protein
MRIPSRFRPVLAGCVLLLGAAAQAGTWGPDESTLMDLAHDSTQQLLTRQVLKDAQSRARGGGRSAQAQSARALTAGRAAPSALQQMAARFPGAQRAEAERTFGQLLTAYHGIEQRFGLERYDLAGAVAAFVVGNLMAYRNEDFQDENFVPLVRQMRLLLGSSPALARASAQEQRQMYEQMAILGMWMAGQQMALKQHPDAAFEARMRRNAQQQLQQFLQVDADRVQATADGLVVR